MAKKTKAPKSSSRKERFPSGKISAEVPYKKGVREGAGKMFYETGELYAEETYKAGKLNGPTITYYTTGKLQAELHYKNGLLDGLCKEYYPAASSSPRSRTRPASAKGRRRSMPRAAPSEKDARLQGRQARPPSELAEVLGTAGPAPNRGPGCGAGPSRSEARPSTCSTRAAGVLDLRVDLELGVLQSLLDLLGLVGRDADSMTISMRPVWPRAASTFPFLEALQRQAALGHAREQHVVDLLGLDSSAALTVSFFAFASSSNRRIRAFRSKRLLISLTATCTTSENQVQSTSETASKDSRWPSELLAMGILIDGFLRAKALAWGYPASTWRTTPMPGSLVRNARQALVHGLRSVGDGDLARRGASSPLPTPPPWWKLTHDAPDAVFHERVRIGQSATASEPSRMASVSRLDWPPSRSRDGRARSRSAPRPSSF